MAREKGTGNLQQEKSGRWTVRIGINGRRLSRSTGTRDRDKAEAFLNRFLAPLGLGAVKLPLAEAWHHYEMSPNRRDIAKSTLESKRTVWMGFARWMEHNHIEIGHLAEVTETAVAEYLAEFRCHHAATTYNNHVCVLREGFVNPSIAEAYTSHKWDVDEGLRRIFKAANITMSVRIEGRSRKRRYGSQVRQFHRLVARVRPCNTVLQHHNSRHAAQRLSRRQLLQDVRF